MNIHSVNSMAKLKQTFTLRLGQCISLLMSISRIRSRLYNPDCLNALIVNYLLFAYIFHNSVSRIFWSFLSLHDDALKPDLVRSCGIGNIWKIVN